MCLIIYCYDSTRKQLYILTPYMVSKEIVSRDLEKDNNI